MAKTVRIKITRPANRQGGMGSGKTEYKVFDYPASEKLPYGGVKVSADAEVTDGWKAGVGPDSPQDADTKPETAEEEVI